MNKQKSFILGAILSLVFLGCTQTYPASRVTEAIQEICRKEYGIENIEVKIVGKTIGVYLPIKKLFAVDFKEALLKGRGKVAELENLFQPSPEAMDQVEDVLFSISRVILSTDLQLQFYLLQATDVEQTGLQLVLVGYAEDIKRVRLWDISRDEYRKRVLHEIKLNRAVVWHRPVHSFFKTLEKAPSLEEVGKHFKGSVTPALLQSLFFVGPHTAGREIHWRLGKLRSTPLEANHILVYVPARVEYDGTSAPRNALLPPPGSLLEYFFIVSFDSDEPRILRVMPLFFLDEAGKVQKVPLPEEMDLDKDIATWETEFSVSEVKLGNFLAEQLTRRTQSLLFSDERIQNTFEALHLNFQYHQDVTENHFSLGLDAKLKSPATPISHISFLHEDVLYLLNLASREFVSVLRSYRFSDYEFLQLNLSSDGTARVLGREDLELFRRNEVDLQGLLASVNPLLT